MRKKEIVEKLLESSSSSPSDEDNSELAQLTDAWELVRRMEMNRSARLQQALQLVSDVISVSVHCFNTSQLRLFRSLCLYHRQ